MILLVHALFFYLPYCFWSEMNSRSGIDINALVEAVKSMHENENNDKPLRYIITQFDRFCGSFRRKHEVRKRLHFEI